MKFFVDIVDMVEIMELEVIGLFDGVIINLFLIVKFGWDFKDVIVDICKIIEGDVLVEVVVIDFDMMIKEVYVLCVIVDNVVIKLLLIFDGLKVCK